MVVLDIVVVVCCGRRSKKKPDGTIIEGTGGDCVGLGVVLTSSSGSSSNKNRKRVLTEDTTSKHINMVGITSR